MTERFSLGIGCSSRATSTDVLRLIRESVESIPEDCLLATLDQRAAMGESVAVALGLRLVLLPASVLAAVRGTVSHSAAALAATGAGSVAEASALAALGPAARLLVAKRTGRFCTCALAVAAQAVEL
jgi:cobalt-precorrin 5A hydrolase